MRDDKMRKAERRHQRQTRRRHQRPHTKLGGPTALTITGQMRVMDITTQQLLPAIPGHQHILNPDGTLGCGCLWPDKEAH